MGSEYILGMKQSIKENKFNINIENWVNSCLKGRSRQEKEEMYRLLCNLREDDTVNFNEQDEITSFSPAQAINKIDLTITINKNGNIDVKSNV